MLSIQELGPTMNEIEPTIRNQVENMPTVIELRKQIRGLSVVSSLLGNKETKQDAKKIEEKLNETLKIVEQFYSILGKRNWVFSDALNLDRVKDILNKDNAEKVEKALIAYLKEPGVLEMQINRLNSFPDMRPRLSLLRKAEKDYREGRYYSSTLVVVTVMDGFVNDANKASRTGLHALKPEDLASEDCVATVFAGLPSVQRIFTKTARKRIDTPLYEVQRHALMHGMATDFDNDIIASKAWCMLFAIADWKKSKEKVATSEKDESSLIDAIRKAKSIHDETKKNMALLDKWEEHEVSLENPSKPDQEVLESYVAYCTAWKNENFGRLADFLPNFTNKSKGAMAGEARETYAGHPITDFIITSIVRPAAAIAVATIQFKSNDQSWGSEIRFARFDDRNQPAAEWEAGSWKVTQYGTAPFEGVC